MADRFANFPDTLSSQARRHAVITPSDTADLVDSPKALYVATDGNLALRDELGTVVVYAVMAGQILPFRPTRVMAAGTTAQVVAWA